MVLIDCYIKETVNSDDHLLHSARNGYASTVKVLLESFQQGKNEININCKGKTKCNLGWSPLHLASYFGHKDVVELLLQYGADINVMNDAGDTPLHKAAFTGRVDVVQLLLQYNADVCVINGEGLKPCNVAVDLNVKGLLTAAEKVDQHRKEEELLNAAREGDLQKLNELLRSPTPPSINCTDALGNTPLHCAAHREHKEVAVLLLQNGVKVAQKNNRGQTASDLARSVQMKQILDVRPIKVIQKHVPRFEGALLKHSRILGWKNRWIVLERGVLTYFSNRADASSGVRRKDFKYLDGASLKLEEDIVGFYIHFNDHSAHYLSLTPEESNQVGRQKWLNALQEHIAYSNHYTNQGTNVSDDDEMEDFVPLGSMQDTLKTAQAHQNLLEQQILALSKIIKNLEENKLKPGSMVCLHQNILQIETTSRNTSLALSHCLTMFSQQEELRKIQLQQEQERCRVLQDSLHVLAQEHHDLEETLASSFRSLPHSPRFFDISDDEFYDAAENSPLSNESDNHCSSIVKKDLARTPSSDSTILPQVPSPCSKWGGRTSLPVPMFSRHDFSVWSILKQCIGKELSKITMPVIFNEPLSFLQRLAEYMEYANLLTKANQSDDPVERMQYVIAFAISACASNWERIGKPFNPLLGETYELSRPDKGFRIICEQVSHHPPISAFFADSEHFRFHGSIHPKLKFWGKSVEIQPKGVVTVELLRHNEAYTWTNVNCCVHNIIVGKLWIEQYGVMEITNHRTGHKAVLNFKPSGWFSKDLHRLEGYIHDREKRKLCGIYGKWTDFVNSVDVQTFEEYIKARKAQENQGKEEKEGVSGLSLEDRRKGSDSSLTLPGSCQLWQADPRPENSAQYYSFTSFAMMLNELDDELRQKLCPTDCRQRPDIVRLENGDIDGAAEEKNRLEEKQRDARKDRKKRKQSWTPRWFYQGINPYTNSQDWLYSGGYWERSFTNCPDIF